MGEGDAEPPRLHSEPHGGGHHFPVGCQVEVQDDEEEGVYFSGTVVSSRRRSGSRNSEKLRVKYHDLLARENQPDRLTESVHISHVRPAPPLQVVAAAKRFEPNDVVDAFYKDGWWKGVVSGVEEGGESFEVTFENPPDVRRFGPDSLRAHWDWVDGVWVGPRKLREAAFEVGEKVEVSFQRDDDSIGAWIPATIVGISGNGAYSVELKDENGSFVKAEADFSNLRPRPPVLQHRIFGALERVEAFFNFGWRSGLITKKVEKNRYDVFLEHLKSNEVLNRWEVRGRMVWKDGRWFVGSALTSTSETRRSSTRRRDNSHWGSRRKRTARVPGKWGGALKKRKNQTEVANQETESLPVDKIAVDDGDPMMGAENVLVQVDEQQTPSTEPRSFVSSVLVDEAPDELGSQETEHLAVEEFVAQDEDSVMGAKNALVQVDDEQQPQSLVSSVVIDEGDLMPVSEWPFAKRNVAWKAIESMEVFRKIPQKPHFHPLREFKETAREGMAIGLMVTFSNVVESSCSLKLNDPKCDMEDIIQTLPDLEANGFNVGRVRNHVVKLLGAKDKVEKLMHDVRQIKDEIAEREYTKCRIKKEMSKIEGHLMRLQQQLDHLQIAKANEVERIAHLQALLDQNGQHVAILRSGFEAVAASVLCSR